MNQTAQADVQVADVQTAVQGLYERHGAGAGLLPAPASLQEEAEDALQTTFPTPVAASGAASSRERDRLAAEDRAQRLPLHLGLGSPPQAARARPGAGPPGGLTPAAPSEPESVIALETALDDLTELQRRAILLREWRGLSYREIAEELELSQSAVETLIFRARRTLARSLDRQDVARPGTLARCLDVGGLLSALKSALGPAAAPSSPRASSAWRCSRARSPTSPSGRRSGRRRLRLLHRCRGRSPPQSSATV